MVEGLSWSGQEGFNNASSRSWSVPGSSSGVSAGDTKSFGKLSFVTIEDAGHMVPYDKPVESLHMLTSWLEGKDL
jgi:carboxypeptidase C (cathepsin A)